MKNIWLFMLVSAFMRKHHGQKVIYPEENDFCTEKMGKDAYCVEFTECPTAEEYFTKGKRPTPCGFSGDVPLVCCTFATEQEATERLCGKINANSDHSAIIEYENVPYTESERSSTSINNTDGSFIIQPRILSRKNQKFLVGSQEWPWMTAIYSKSNSSFLCNGFFIDKTHVLTVAHCFRESRRQPQDYHVGTIYDEEQARLEVTELHIHDGYKDDHYNDIALLKVSSRLADKSAICMPSDERRNDRLTGRNITVLDWIGRLYVNQRAEVAEVKLCDQVYTNLSNSPFPEGVTDAFICAIPLERTNNVCQIHAGGPVMIEENGKWTVIGIASFGVPCVLPTYPAVYTRIFDYLKWIKDNE